MKRCMYCGHENEDSLVTCSVCGNKLGVAVPTQEPVTADDAARFDAAPPSFETASVDSLGQAGNAAMEDGSLAASAGGAVTAGLTDLPAADKVLSEQHASDEAMVTQEPAFAGQVPVNKQFSEIMPAGQFPDRTERVPEGQYGDAAESTPTDQYGEGMGNAPASQYGESVENAMAGLYGAAAGSAAADQYGAAAGSAPANQYTGQYADNMRFASGPDMTPGYGEDWRQDVGRGQTYGARTQYEAMRDARRAQAGAREGVTGGTYSGNGQYGPQRDQYGSAGYGYRQNGAQEVPGQGGRQDYGRRESAGGSKMFMVRARKRVKSVTFFLMALCFTAMLGLNVYNIFCGNALRNITESETMLANILSGTGTNFFTQMLTELASQLVKMVVNVQDIIAQLGKTVEWGIAIVFLVPNVLYCLALWLMFFRTDTKRRQFPMGGYTLARVMMILKFLIGCLVLAIGLVISVYFVVVGAQRKSGSIDSSLIQGVILLIVMIVLSVFVVMYYIQWMFCLKVVRDNAKKGTDPGRMPGFVVFLSIMCTAVCVLLMIPMAPNDYIGLAARGAAAAYFLVSGLWVLIYKIRVKRN